MGFMRNKRIRQVIRYGWKDAGEIADYSVVKKSRITIFLDILCCFYRYYVFSNQYKNMCFWSLTEQERLDLARKMGAANKKKDRYVDVHYSDWQFLSKYTPLKWQNSPKRIKQRNVAYIKHYGLGETISVQYGVTIICEHYSVGKITCGKKVLLARNCDIDYTGDIEIGNHVSISEGVKILTHNHSIDLGDKGLDKGCIPTPLKINDNVWIGARAIIMPGVKEIGRGAIISADSYVNSKIPPYAIVLGNPAKIVGFRMPLEEIIEYEKSHYEEKDRISSEILSKNYEKYFQSRWKDIKQWRRL